MLDISLYQGDCLDVLKTLPVSTYHAPGWCGA